MSPEHLGRTTRGLASGPWLADYGLQTTRGFGAPKIWMALMEHGAERFGRLIDRNIARARSLAEQVEAEPALELELVAPTSIDIMCYRYRREGVDEPALRALNVEIMLRLQEAGTAAVSDTTLRGRHCLRAAITNHRTRDDDLALLIRESVRLGDAIARDGRCRS